MFDGDVVKRPRSYYLALCLATDVFSKSVERILHGMSDGYYLALIRLPKHRLDLLDIHTMTHKECMEAMDPKKGRLYPAYGAALDVGSRLGSDEEADHELSHADKSMLKVTRLC